MTSIQDVADQINAKLDAIVANTTQTVALETDVRTELQTVVGEIGTLDAHLQAGVANLAAGLFAVWQVERAQLVELRHQSDQNDTIVCLLQNADDLLCGITRKLSTQLEISRHLATSLDRVEGIAERVDAAAAGDYDRLVEVTERIERCCPAPVPAPEPCPEPCPVADYKPYRPTGQDWKPQPPPEPQPGPVG